MRQLQQEMAGLSTAEEFLDHFAIAYERRVVDVNRLHILKRFHDYLDAEGEFDGFDEEACRAICSGLLLRAYLDFVESDAITEKVFKVHQDQANRYVPLTSLGLPAADAAG
ncbi:MAG: nitrogen fixation protein NifW [Azospirillum sp.]|nr:nitrogen fixation protein NifW [Azospirillum sp.]